MTEKVEAQRDPSTRTLWRSSVPGPLTRLPGGEVVCCDALTLLHSLGNEIADLIFLDPPFNLGKKYGSRSKKADLHDEAVYANFMTQILARSIDVLRPGGALYLYHLPRWAFQFANVLHAHLDFRHWIAISMKNGFVRGKSLYPAHYALVYFTKGKPRSFNRPKIPVARCRHCNGYVKDYGGYERYVQDGINLGDVWDDLSPVRHPKKKSRKANELPFELPKRVLEISGFSGGLFVDPFAGSGTTLLAAHSRGMQFIAADHDSENVKVIASRISDVELSGTRRDANG